MDITNAKEASFLRISHYNMHTYQSAKKLNMGLKKEVKQWAETQNKQLQTEKQYNQV